MSKKIKKSDRIIRMQEPLVVCFQNEKDKTEIHIHMKKGWNYSVFSVILADIAQNIADAFEVPADDVWTFALMARKSSEENVTHPSDEEAAQRLDEVYVKKCNWN